MDKYTVISDNFVFKRGQHLTEEQLRSVNVAALMGTHLELLPESPAPTKKPGTPAAEEQ